MYFTQSKQRAAASPKASGADRKGAPGQSEGERGGRRAEERVGGLLF